MTAWNVLKSPIRRHRSNASPWALIVSLLLTLLTAFPAQSADLPPLSEKVATAQHMPGYFDLYWDNSTGTMYWEIDKLDTEFLYQVSMGSGLGSNPIGIDRGQVRGTHILEAKRVGPRVLLVEPNYRYRASSENELERTAVKDAFAPSVHWGFDIVAEGADSVLVDATDFFLRDARNVVGQIKGRKQGEFKLEKSRSAFFLENTAAFPENIEIEAMLTFVSDAPGDLVNKVAATGSAITLRQHHSIVKLPEAGFKTRISDPRIGTNGPTIQDYGTAIGDDLVVRLVARHRLEKKNPEAERSEAIEPIVYYLDPGVPEPIKSALMDGGRWWNQAFEAAGFIDAFQVRELPPGADAQDIRYNMIHWTHRRTRGYSYGYSVVDPRTGEIIKGNVNLGSLRLRQDYLHGQGLMPAFDYLTAAAGDNSASVKLALDRVRQLSAHEIGHTLGFPHNYLASSYGRESVMDYPAPLVEITEDGQLDFSNAYLQRIGEYDKLAVRYSYTQFDDNKDEAAELEKIVQESLDTGLLFMAHNNNHFRGAGHPYASVWDNGDNLVDHLKHEIAVREIGLKSFGETTIRVGEPVSTLEYVLLPLYMHHRFQMNAAAQSIGGADYRNTMRGDGQTPLQIIDADEQRNALATVLSTLDVDFLALPQDILALLPPPAQRYNQGEAFPGRAGIYFDSLAAVEAAASLTVQTLLHPARLERLVAFGSMGNYPTLEEVVDALIDTTWSADEPADKYRQKVLQVIQHTATHELMASASNPASSDVVRAVLGDRLNRLRVNLEKKAKRDPHRYSAAASILRWQENGEAPDAALLKMPPGDPI